jgi:hypothetical protein
MRARLSLVVISLTMAACSAAPPPPDACDGSCNAGDSAPTDSVTTDTGPIADATDTTGLTDSTTRDATNGDAHDATIDSTMDAPVDVGSVDAAPDVRPVDSGVVDAGHDSGTAGCVSGATGTRAVRFRWNGSGAGSTAYVQYLANGLPDTSRWHVSANSMSFGYTPVFDDIFLGAGGLDLEGTAFMDVQISTAGLASISNVTIAIFGRSFNTTTNGSFSWRTFTGTGAAPTDLVSNVAPYQWYLADATTEFVTGDSGVLLRIYPGPSSNALIVNTVEICFDAM